MRHVGSAVVSPSIETGSPWSAVSSSPTRRIDGHSGGTSSVRRSARMRRESSIAICAESAMSCTADSVRDESIVEDLASSRMPTRDLTVESWSSRATRLRSSPSAASRVFCVASSTARSTRSWSLSIVLPR